MNKKIKHPFIATDAYFEELKENILAQTVEGKVLEEHGKKNIYTVPEGFFDLQYKEILDKKQGLSAPHQLFPVLTPKRTMVWATSTVATLLVIVLAYSYFGTQEINDLLYKEGTIIQSDVTDMGDKLTKSKIQTDSTVIDSTKRAR